MLTMLRKFLPLVAIALCVQFQSFAQDALADKPVIISPSEYPSWSTFLVACETKVNGELIIDGHPGKRGLVEKMWDVDLEIRAAEYDPGLNMYGSREIDGVCVTNIDILTYAMGRPSVAIMPTSTSFGADVCIVSKDITSIDQLRDIPTFGLQNSVSDYLRVRVLEQEKKPIPKFRMDNMTPEDAARVFLLDLQNNRPDHRAIIVWNPYVRNTLLDGAKFGAHDLFNSTRIPGEIIDMVVLAKETAQTERGKRAACAIIQAQYMICQRMADATTQVDTIKALAEKFCRPEIVDRYEETKKCVYETRFFATPEQGISLFTGGVTFPWKRQPSSTTVLFTNTEWNPKATDVTKNTLKDTMTVVVRTWMDHEAIREVPKIFYGHIADAKDAKLIFDPSFMEAVAARMKSDKK
jgi:hypothetical protein